MSTAFEDMMKADLAGILSASGEFAESVTYVPRNGATRPIYADVVRNPPATPSEIQNGKTPSLVITVQNSATLGIAASELDTGGDAIRLNLQLDDTDTTDILLPKPDTQDAGQLTFRIGKR